MSNGFGTYLRTLRIERGMSISYLAQGTGISRKTIQRWENGINTPKSFATIQLLADFFHVSKDFFFRDGHTDDYTDLRKEVRLLREEVADLRRHIKA